MVALSAQGENRTAGRYGFSFDRALGVTYLKGLWEALSSVNPSPDPPLLQLVRLGGKAAVSTPARIFAQHSTLLKLVLLCGIVVKESYKQIRMLARYYVDR